MYSRGMESGLDSIHSLCSSLRFLLSSILSAVSSSRRCARQPHPLKEDDRLEDTQAPANGFVLLASIGIKRIASPSPAVRFAERRRRRRGGEGKSKWAWLHNT